MHHEFFISTVFNRYIANPIAGLFGYHTDHDVLPPHLVMIILAFLFLTLFSLWLRRRLSVDSPGSIQQGVELLVAGIQSMMRDVIGSDDRRFFPLLGALFIYILLCNLMGQVPGFMSPTANINVPASMAVISFLYYNYHGFRVQGPVNYIKHFAGPVLLLAPLIFAVEVVSHFARMVSLSLRLFGNLFAEELASASLADIFPFLVPLPTVALGLFASLIQAFIFIVLSMVYIGQAIAEEH